MLRFVGSVNRHISLANLDIQYKTYNLTPISLWTVLEPNLGIMNAYLPIIQPMINKLSTL